MTSKPKHEEISDSQISNFIHRTHIDKDSSGNNISIIAAEHLEESAYSHMPDHSHTIIKTESEEYDQYTCHNETYSNRSDVEITTVNDNSVFRMGECFDSYEALRARLEYHSDQSHVQYWRRDSRTVQAALMKTARPIQPVLKYYSVKYTCVHGGAKFSPRGNGQRNTMTLRLECPAHIMVRANKSGKELEVVSVCNHHNHQVSAHLYHSLPQNRRLPTKLKEEVLDFLRMQIPRRKIKDYVFCKTGKEITNKYMLNLMALDKRIKSIPTIERIASLNEVLENFESDPDVIQQLEQKADTICDKSNNSTKVSVSRKRKKRIDQDCDMKLKKSEKERAWMKPVRLQNEANAEDKSGNTVRYVHQEPFTSCDTTVENAVSYIDRNVIVETIETKHTSLPIHFTIQDNQNKTWFSNGLKFKCVAFDSLANILGNNEITNATVIVEESESNNDELSGLDHPNGVMLDQQIENDTIVTDSMAEKFHCTDTATVSEIDNDGNIESTETELVETVDKCDNCYSIENNLNANVNDLRCEKNTLLEEIESLRAQKEHLIMEIENIKNNYVKVVTVHGGDDVRLIGETEGRVECIFVEKRG